MQIFYENMLEKHFSIWLYAWKQNFFFFLTREINLKVLKSFLMVFFLKYFRENQVF